MTAAQWRAVHQLSGQAGWSCWVVKLGGQAVQWQDVVDDSVQLIDAQTDQLQDVLVRECRPSDTPSVTTTPPHVM